MWAVARVREAGINETGYLPVLFKTIGAGYRPINLEPGSALRGRTPWVELNNRQAAVNIQTGRSGISR